jgi:hypothetical protein
MDTTVARSQVVSPVEAWSYRDAEQPLRVQREALLRRRRRELEALPRDLVRTYSRRVARTCAGLLAAGGAIAIVADALLTKLGDPGFLAAHLPPLTKILVATLCLVVPVYAAARTVARLRIRRLLRRELEPSGDVISDVARLEHRSAPALAAELADRLERRSVAWPLVGASLILPLTLHLPFGVMLNRSNFLESFDWWICASLVLVLPAHLLLAFLSWRFARTLSRWTPSSLQPLGSGWAVFGWVCVAGLVPGVVLFAIPPILVALTGLAFIPAMFSIMRRRVLDERLQFEAAAAL